MINKCMLIVCAATVALSAAAQQEPARSRNDVEDGQITFVGEVTAPTCVINGGNGGENFEVVLPSVSSERLNVAGKTAGDTEFHITLRACGAMGNKVRANFQKGMIVDTETGHLGIVHNAGRIKAADNVQLELASKDTNAPIVIGVDQQTTAYFPIDAQGSADMAYVVRYYATGKAHAGRVRSQVTYLLQYL